MLPLDFSTSLEALDGLAWGFASVATYNHLRWPTVTSRRAFSKRSTAYSNWPPQYSAVYYKLFQAKKHLFTSMFFLICSRGWTKKINFLEKQNQTYPKKSSTIIRGIWKKFNVKKYTLPLKIIGWPVGSAIF